MSKELKCWSCKAVFTLTEHGNCDGCCWKCGVEIDLDEMDIQPADQHPQGTRERFQKWVLSIEHPVKGWLDGHWLRRGDDREGYADEYVQGLWVAFKAFGGQPADQQGDMVRSVKRYERDVVSGHCDVEIGLLEHKILHHDHGPNLAEAVARLAYRIAKFHKLHAPTLASHAQPATAKVDERLAEATAFVQKLCDAASGQPSVATGYLSDILDMLRGRSKLNTPQ